MDIVVENPTTDKTQDNTTPEPQGYMLGRELDNLPLRHKVGCGSLYHAMEHVLPPYHMRLLMRKQLAGDRSVQGWLQRGW